MRRTVLGAEGGEGDVPEVAAGGGTRVGSDPGHGRSDARRALHRLSVMELAAAICGGAVTSTQVTEHFLERIERLDPHLGAFRRVTGDRALREAAAADAALARGDAVGPLHGVPYAAKDLFDLAGEPTDAGSDVLGGAPALADAEVVARLSAAGMILLGKTNTVEFAYGGVGINHVQGTPRNPWSDEHHVPGGSSSGSGVAVAAGLAPFALGTDTGGSVRIPAALCGTVGLKTTFGVVSRRGVFPLSPTLDSVGPLTRTVEDAAVVFDAIAGPGVGDRRVFLPAQEGGAAPDAVRAGVRGMRLGLPRGVFFDEVDGEHAAAVRAAAEVLAAAGAEVEEVDFLIAEETLQMQRRGRLIAAEAFALHRDRLERSADRMDPVVASRIVQGRDVSADEYLEGVAERSALQLRADDAFGDLDALLVPTTQLPPLPIAEVDRSLQTYSAANARYLRNTSIGNALGLCGLSVPCGFTAAGFPIGLMIYGRAFAESTVLRVGRAYEQATDWGVRFPKLAADGEGVASPR